MKITCPVITANRFPSSMHLSLAIGQALLIKDNENLPVFSNSISFMSDFSYPIYHFFKSILIQHFSFIL